jgi:hypothetical protein
MQLDGLTKYLPFPVWTPYCSLLDQLRKRKFTYAKSLLAQLQTNEREPLVAG